MLFKENILRKQIRSYLLREQEPDEMDRMEAEAEEEDEANAAVPRRPYETAVEQAKAKIIEEMENHPALKDYPKNKQGAQAMVNNTALILIDRIPDMLSATATIMHFSLNEDGKPMKDIDLLEGIKDELSSENLINYKRWNKSPIQNPLVVISQAAAEINADKKGQLVSTVTHEIDHIKNNFIQLFIKDLNVDAVKNLLRKDLINLNKKQILEKFMKEKLFDAARKKPAEGVVNIMFPYYKTVLTEKNKNKEEMRVAVDEFAVRINEMKRSGKLEEIIDRVKNKTADSKYLNQFSMEVIQVVPFLKKKATKELFDKIVIVDDRKKTKPA